MTNQEIQAIKQIEDRFRSDVPTLLSHTKELYDSGCWKEVFGDWKSAVEFALAPALRGMMDRNFSNIASTMGPDFQFELQLLVAEQEQRLIASYISLDEVAR